MIDTGFRPSEHGLPFPNDIAWGLCGGFVRLARKLFIAGEPVPESPRVVRLILEQLGTLQPLALIKVLSWSTWPTEELQRAAAGEWISLRWRLRTTPVPLMLIYADNVGGVFGNHQVLAWSIDETVRDGPVLVYDPNQPGNDQVTLASLAPRGWYCME